jgi:hypothetical protein
MMGREMVPEMVVVFRELTRLIAREDFINIIDIFTATRVSDIK